MNGNHGQSLTTIGSRDLAAIGHHHSHGQDRLDLADSFAFFRRHALLILGTTTLVLLVALAASLLMPKTYRAKAVVMLVGNAAQAGQADPTRAGQVAISNELVETQAEVITSRDMAERVVDRLDLDKGMNAQQRETLVTDLDQKVGAERTGESYALAIHYDARTPGEAALIANTFAQQYSQWDLLTEQQRNADTRKSMEGRLIQLRAQAQADTQALQQYRIANNLLSTSGASLTEQEISNYNQEVAKAKAEAAEDEARLNTALRQLKSGSNGDDVGEALGSQVVSGMRAQETQLAGQVASLSARYGQNHPELIRTRSQLAEVRQQIQAEIGRVVSNLRAKADVSNQRLTSLTASLGTAQSKLSQNNAAMVGLTGLERNAAASQAIYDNYLSSYKQLLAAEGTERPNARVLTWASPPRTPLSPNLKLNMALAAVIGLGLGILAAYVAEALLQGLTTPEQVEDLTGQPFLASIPLLSSVGTGQSQTMSAIRDEPYSVFTEAFRALGTSLDMSTHGSAKVVAITSALPGEGKTVVSSCLAHIYATSGLRTVLIDCDLRRQGISRLLNLRSRQNGLLEVLDGRTKVNFKGVDNEEFVFWTLPIIPSDEDGEQLIAGQPFADLLEQLRGQFDRIVLDLPPVLPVAYTRTVAARADTVVMIAHWRKTSAFALRAALRRLPPDQVNVAGVALNQVDMRRRAYFGRLDPAFYYKKYREYYA
ncbi:MAG: AAA family ATPase [Sphingomonadales bacterium]|nr:AAA family ATPase [Sphingomonadales bacterium]